MTRLDRTAPLLEWDRLLREHFRRLRERRGDWPLFALEHGLAPAELEELVSAVRAAIRVGPPRHTETLPWIVYATELGYRYSGESYWPAFEEQTPGWRANGRRTWLRSAFQRFAREFNGVEPKSQWAQHFSIIAWPITHAILPKDLQRHLAHLLFQVHFTASAFSSAEALGRYLHQVHTTASSRFQELAENEILLGQIAAGLLLESQSSELLLLPSTLSRLVADIEKERAARQWLSTARRRVGRLNIKGLGSVRARLPETSSRDNRTASVRIQPRLMLLRNPSGVWDVWLELPSFAPIAAVFPEAREFLECTRAVLRDGLTDRPLARGRLLDGVVERLSSWPSAESRCLEVLGAPPSVAAVVHGLRYPVEIPTVFRVVEEGCAVQLLGREVRPGGTYILVQGTALPVHTDDIQPVPLGVPTVHAFILRAPPLIGADWLTTLKELGVAVGQRLDVWPAGAGAAAWDDQGYCEYLSGEPVILGIRSDHEAHSIEVHVEGQPSVHLDWPADRHNGPAFIEVGEFETGSHRVLIRVETSRGPVQGQLEVVTREPGATGRTGARCSALDLRTAPVEPSLEALWEGTADVAVIGPPGTEAHCELLLWERGAVDPCGHAKFDICLPCPPDEWRRTWFAKVVELDRHHSAYDLAYSAELTVAAGALGSRRLVLKREMTPLRWAIAHQKGRVTLRLVDDIGEGTPNVEAFWFDTPDQAQLAKWDAPSGEVAIEGQGGLVVARGAGYDASTVVALPFKARAFGDLVIESKLRALPRTTAALCEYLDLIQRWQLAHLRGSSYASYGRRKVVAAMRRNLIGTIAGERWAQAELEVLHGRKKVDELVGYVARPKHPAVQQLIGLAATLSGTTPSCVVHRLAAVCRNVLVEECSRLPGGVTQPVRQGLRRRVDQTRWVCEFALRICSAPETVRPWAGDCYSDGFAKLLASPALLRAARYVHLALSAFPEMRFEREEAWEW